MSSKHDHCGVERWVVGENRDSTHSPTIRFSLDGSYNPQVTAKVSGNEVTVDIRGNAKIENSKAAFKTCGQESVVTEMELQQ